MSAPADLASFRGLVAQRVDQRLDGVLADIESPAVQPLVEAMRYALVGGGKRVRPTLCVASALLFDDAALDSAATLAAAASVEMIHAYSLIHDDLPAMDDDALRRGRPTTHIAFDEATAILAGDALQALAFETLASAPGMEDASRSAAVVLLSRASGACGMVGGQMIDLEVVGTQPDLDALNTMHGLKTGELIRASVLLGAHSAGCSDAAALDRLGRFAAQIGLAFQIQDDILDATGSTEVLGKTRCADAARGKPTYVSLLGVAGARARLEQAHAEAVSALEPFRTATLLVHLAEYIVARTH